MRLKVLSLLAFLPLPLFATLPTHFTDFQVYATTTIDYARSDFQGITGAADAIHFSHFSILDDRSQLGRFQNPFSYSVFTRQFVLTNGGVEQGGVYARDYARIEYAHVHGKVATSQLRSHHAQTRGQVRNGRRVDFDSITDSLFQYSYSLAQQKGREASTVTLSNGTYQLFKAINNDGKLENIFEVSSFQNFIIDASNDPREYFVIINRSSEVDLSYLDIKLKGGAEAAKVLFFFPNATKVTMTKTGVSTDSGREAGIGLPGSLLAPFADFYFLEGLVTGNVYAKSLNGSPASTGGHFAPGGQINYGPFVCFQYRNCRSPYDVVYE